MCIWKSQNHLYWKRPLGSWSPTAPPALPRAPLNHIPEGHIHGGSEGFRKVMPGEPVPMFDSLAMKKCPQKADRDFLWHNLRLFPSGPITCYLGHKIGPRLGNPWTFCSRVEEIDRVPFHATLSPPCFSKHLLLFLPFSEVHHQPGKLPLLRQEWNNSPKSNWQSQAFPSPSAWHRVV